MFHYQVLRKGPDRQWVILLHGLGGSSSIWYKQVDAYARHANVVLVDLYGHGKTRDTLPAYSFEALAAGVFCVMDELELESAHITGISLGSILASVMGAIAPHRVNSLILGGAVPGLNLRSRFLLHAAKVLRYAMPYMWLYRLFALIMMPRRRHAKSRGIFVREAKKLGRPEFLKWYRMLQAFPRIHRNLSRRLRDTNVPKLFISGSEDHLFLRMVKNYVRTDPLASLHILERCGHVCNIENPGEFNQASLGYMTGISARQPAYTVIEGLRNTQKVPAAGLPGQLTPGCQPVACPSAQCIQSFGS